MAQVPVTETLSGENYPGKFVWHDLLTSDPRSCGRFYPQLFGWQIEYHDDYVVACNDDRPVAGLLRVAPSDSRPDARVWIPSVSVPDMDEAAARVSAG